jgi:hypothetical protein
MLQCKLCGTPLNEEDIEEHRKNHHSWYDGSDIIKKKQ